MNKSWDRLKIPDGIPEQGLPQENELSFFNDTTSFRLRRRGDIESVLAALQRVINGEPLRMKVISSRYGAGLNSLGSEDVKQLADTLKKYLIALCERPCENEKKAIIQE